MLLACGLTELLGLIECARPQAVEYLMRSNTQLEKAVKQMDPKNV